VFIGAVGSWYWQGKFIRLLFFPLRDLIRNPTGFTFFPPVIILGASIIFSLRDSLFFDPSS
jgi:hypothetical protein